MLCPPSTAATLNLAAVAAQASRLWLKIDASFARHSLDVAEAAWRGARRHPVRLAPASDNRGGGAYADDEVGDEFYWAAAELFLTTGRDEYRDYLRGSAFDRAIAPDLVIDGLVTSSGLTWQRVASLGQISRALAGERAQGRLTRGELERYRSQLSAIGDTLLATLAKEGYPKPPPGAVSGGPNTDLQDPYVRAAGLQGCAPQKCFIDHIEAYSVNEVAINWNAALAWSAIWLDARGRR